jgi:hypothetical protein
VKFSTAQYIKETAQETPLRYNQKSAWEGIGTGLGLVVWGYGALVAGVGLGTGILWHVSGTGPLKSLIGPAQHNRAALLPLGIAIIGLSVLVSSGLILTGQWRCLMDAPQQQKSKGFLLVSLAVFLFALVLSIGGVCLDGARTYNALLNGGPELSNFDACTPGNLLLAGAAGLVLFSSLLFSQFLRNVSACFDDAGQMRSVDTNLAFVGLLLGGSVGIMFCAYRFAFRAEVLPWLIGGWLVCVVWQLLLASGVRQCIDDGLRGCLEDSLSDLPAPAPEPEARFTRGSVTMNTLSGLRRLASKGNYGT